MRKRRVVGRIYGMKNNWKSHEDRNRHKDRIKRSGQARLVYVKNINSNNPTTWRWANGDTVCQHSVRIIIIHMFNHSCTLISQLQHSRGILSTSWNITYVIRKVCMRAWWLDVTTIEAQVRMHCRYSGTQHKHLSPEPLFASLFVHNFLSWCK